MAIKNTFVVLEVITLFFKYSLRKIKRTSFLGLQVYPTYFLNLPQSTGPHEIQKFGFSVPQTHFNLGVSLLQQLVHTALQWIVTAERIVKFLLFY